MPGKKTNIIKFPTSPSKIERQVEAILFAASEPLDIQTIEKRVQSSSNIKNILENIKNFYKNRGINLVCIKNKWSFRTADDLSKLMSLQKSTQKIIKSYYRNFGNNRLPPTSNKIRNREIRASLPQILLKLY